MDRSLPRRYAASGVLIAGLYLLNPFLQVPLTGWRLPSWHGADFLAGGLMLCFLNGLLLLARRRPLERFFPASLFLLGDRAWKLPKWLDKIIPSVDVEGTTLEGMKAPTKDGDTEKELVTVGADSDSGKHAADRVSDQDTASGKHEAGDTGSTGGPDGTPKSNG